MPPVIYFVTFCLLLSHTAQAAILLLPDMDPSINPRVDFYHYSNGSWLTKTEIPPNKSSYGSFTELSEQNWQKVKGILDESSSAKAAPGTIVQKVGDFYASAMDTDLIAKEGLASLQPYFKEIEEINSTDGLIREIARLQQYYISPIFDFYVTTDEKSSEQMAFYLTQGGLGLPGKEYYFSPIHAKVRAAYPRHIAQLFHLMGESEEASKVHAQTVIDIETKLATDSRSRVELRDPERNYHPLTLAVISNLAPDFPWKGYFTALGLGEDPHGVVGQPEFFGAVNQLIKERSLNDWKIYLRWNVIESLSSYLGTAFEQEDFDFNSSQIRGTREMEPRWQRTARQADHLLGEALGQLYVAKYFTPETKVKAMHMMNELLQVFHSRLERVEWMTPATRQKALEKFAALRLKIGCPDKWIDYSKLEIDRGPYVRNVLRCRFFDFHRRLAKLGHPVDKLEWHMTPDTVNAYNNPTGNEVVFPAGILQPPFFDPEADDAVNFGGIGAVIAHEITHGYDDQGRKYDAKGNLKEWWTPQDAEQFQKRTQLLVTQYNKYEPLPGIHINGELCLGENIADLGGVSIAFEALQHSLRNQAQPALLEGLTPSQRFYLAWARIWRIKYRDADLQSRLTLDPHSPGLYRAIGAASHVDSFFDAFGINAGDPMWYPAELRVKIW